MSRTGSDGYQIEFSLEDREAERQLDTIEKEIDTEFALEIECDEHSIRVEYNDFDERWDVETVLTIKFDGLIDRIIGLSGDKNQFFFNFIGEVDSELNVNMIKILSGFNHSIVEGIVNNSNYKISSGRHTYNTWR